jgi:MFS family permease
MSSENAAASATPARTFGFVSVLVIGILAATQSADPGITSVAMPSIAKDLGFSGAGLSLAVSIGTLSLAATVIAIGALADRIGVRRVIMIGLVLEALGNLIVAVSPSLAVLLLGRVVAGVGMGALFAGAFSMVPAIAGKRTIAAVIGQWTGLLYIFTIIFSIIGSALIGISWRAGFILIPVVCLIMMLVVPKTLPETPRRGSSKFDFLGLSTLGLGMVLVLVAVSLAATSLGSPTFWICLIIGIIMLGLFAVIEKKSPNAAFPIELFKSPVFVAAVLAGILWNFGESGMLLQASNFWQHVVGVSPSVVGVAIAPLLIAGIIAGFAAGALLGRGMSPVLIQAIGFILMILGFLSVAFTTVDTKLVAFFPALILVGLGMVAVAVVQAREYVAEAPAKYLSAVVSSRTSVGQLGYSLGVALTSTLIALGVSEEGGDVVPSEFVPAFNSTMLIVAGILAVGGVVTAILLSIGLKRRKTLALAGPSDAPLEPSSGEQPLG